MNGKGLFNKGAEPYRELIGAWAAYSNFLSIDELSQLSDKHPEVVLRKVLAKGGQSNKQRSLRLLNDVCREQHAAGSLDFSLRTIGELCEARGILQRNSLRHKDFDDHRFVIQAWYAFARPWFDADSQASATRKRLQKSHDLQLTWIARDHPDLAEWHSLAVEWLKVQTVGIGHRMAAVIAFFDVYLAHPAVPKQPKDMLMLGRNLPDFRTTACPSSSAGVSYNNYIWEMMDWVLLKEFSMVADDGSRVVLPAFRNPLSHIKKSGDAVNREGSVRSPLPYGYIDELRHILAEGPYFRDWKFAQTALGADIGEKGAPGRDWFDVTEDMVDRNDPDCVFRVRMRGGENVLQMWSPVRWVAVLIKLLLPVRTAQVRLLDSGEFDSEIFVDGQWTVNERERAFGKNTAKRRQGVLRKLEGSDTDVILYFNTNKSADKGKDGPAKGYEVAWHVSPDVVENVYYWLEKLRDWQAKYNPVDRLTSWSELDARHINLKSEVQLAGYPDACFLFRMPEVADNEKHLPVTDGIVDIAWCNLLEEFQIRLSARGERHLDGSIIQFINVDELGRFSTAYPLHSLRVSLVTALALLGEVPFPILQKLVGHSRLLMTLYYTKPSATQTAAVLVEAAAKLDLNKEKSISDYLLNQDYEKLLANAIWNNQETFAASIPQHPAWRNPAGWMLMHIGLCLVGGNTGKIEDNKKIGGCYNGGPNLGSSKAPRHGPTPGGTRNCIRCRWFVTEPHFLPSLAAHFNTIAFHFDEARNRSMDSERKLQEIKRQKAQMEAVQDGPSFDRYRELREAERIMESQMSAFNDLAEDLVACWRLVERCQVLINSPQDEGGQQVLVQGDVFQVQAIFEETESELLQLSGVCDSLQLYPDLNADKAVIRRSQLLDSALYNEGLPPVFMQLSEHEQLLAGNAFMQRLALELNPTNPAVGKRQVVALMDAGKRLSEHLGVELDASFLPQLPTHTKPNKYIKIARIENDGPG
ncbi:integrase [Duganella sp. FT50W]|uniref:Integrase n=2 Tax=Duganella lactea TaxID=2692173 RepID=A0A6L8MH25_9BURK|nr:integrase [Duganella lactea]